jgi:hypothetical protein
MAKIISILTILGFLCGAALWVDNHYAKCAEVKAIERRLDYKIESDKLAITQGRLWTLEDRYGMDPAKVQNSEVRQQMKELKAYIDNQKGVVQSIRGK